MLEKNPYIDDSSMKVSTLEKIGNNAFTSSKIKSISIPSTVTEVGESVFKNCVDLQTVEWKAGYATIPTSTFENCKNLTSFTIEDNIKTIGMKAFASSGLQSIIIPSTIETISSQAFKDCTSMTTMTYPNKGTIEYSNDIFENCMKLETIEISGVGSIPNYSSEKQPWYSVRQYLTTVNFGVDINGVGDYAFYGCSALKNIDLTKIKSIGTESFRQTGIELLHIPTTMETINSKAFGNCKQLKKVEYPPNKVNSDPTMLEESTNIEEFIIYGIGEIVSYEQDKQPWASVRNSIKKITINEGITIIGSYSFASMTVIKSITLPSSVTKVKNNAFEGCNEVTLVELSSVEIIETKAFASLSKLNSIFIPTSVHTIGTGAFRDCTALEDITIPKTVTSIGASVFYNCAFARLEYTSDFTNVSNNNDNYLTYIYNIYI